MVPLWTLCGSRRKEEAATAPQTPKAGYCTTALDRLGSFNQGDFAIAFPPISPFQSDTHARTIV